MSRVSKCGSPIEARTTKYISRSRSEAREATYVSLYDGTVEGLDFGPERARSAQFHPEAAPGPHDAASVIARWVDELKAA